ncbi:hypothetical protein chiPu_0017982 [Chiloscyllium punctatum]|uniref:Uncharacterized protein n=1 Tax=Chiloscyllium punctatum TaxID=137246 RepID=A0A401RK92_CHIPU|nr:hypothetical protein [Chiloscyllium punctatum]
MLRYARAQKEVTWCSVSRARQGHVGSDIRERKETENGVRSTANQKIIPPQCVVQRLLPYTQYEASSVRRGGVVGTLRNCCFDHSHHQWLLSNEVDILPYLLLPLAGPEELSEDEMEGLPVDLQYLPEDKRREKDPDIRKMLLEAINLLMATRSGRKVVREKKTYIILREYHKWETEPDVAAACEKLIEVLISDEPEPGMENLLEVEIPEEIEGKLKLQHEEEQQRIAKEKEELLKSSEDGREHGHRGRGDSPEGLGRRESETCRAFPYQGR